MGIGWQTAQLDQGAYVSCNRVFSYLLFLLKVEFLFCGICSTFKFYGIRSEASELYKRNC